MALYTIDVVVQDTRKDDQLASLRFLRETEYDLRG